MNILLLIAAIGGFIKIIETTVKIIKWADIKISNVKFWRRVNKNMRRLKKG